MSKPNEALTKIMTYQVPESCTDLYGEIIKIKEIAQTALSEATALPSPQNDKTTTLENKLFSLGEMNKPPCFCCGYNGEGYYQPEKHPCAERHHKFYNGAVAPSSQKQEQDGIEKGSDYYIHKGIEFSKKEQFKHSGEAYIGCWLWLFMWFTRWRKMAQPSSAQEGNGEKTLQDVVRQNFLVHIKAGVEKRIKQVGIEIPSDKWAILFELLEEMTLESFEKSALRTYPELSSAPAKEEQKGLRWVKASERLPDVAEFYFIRRIELRNGNEEFIKKVQFFDCSEIHKQIWAEAEIEWLYEPTGE